MTDKNKIMPMHDKIVVKKKDGEDKTPGGILLPESAKDKPIQGTVIAVGSGVRDKDGKVIPLDVKIGDQIIFAKWGGTEIKFDGEEYLIIKESDVLAKLV
ncbi:co-chaperone GroES [Lyticum sinuosum]|uniref:Co-chaperonin GroES n=1 Tax=Lyticum sinuosum TaxID=1332059 RepID=A0AAE5AGW1_9RICK|nr:co-chaperone GroES [Lyticum sinuosum]MDZ5761282.1 10 kDa chaperonin 1 [Lyticum sinuosum]